MKAIKNFFFPNRDSHAAFSASLATKTRTELVMLTNTLARNEKAHPGMLRMAEKRLARMDGFRGA